MGGGEGFSSVACGSSRSTWHPVRNSRNSAPFALRRPERHHAHVVHPRRARPSSRLAVQPVRSPCPPAAGAASVNCSPRYHGVRVVDVHHAVPVEVAVPASMRNTALSSAFAFEPRPGSPFASSARCRTSARSPPAPRRCGAATGRRERLGGSTPDAPSIVNVPAGARRVTRLPVRLDRRPARGQHAVPRRGPSPARPHDGDTSAMSSLGSNAALAALREFDQRVPARTTW